VDPDLGAAFAGRAAVGVEREEDARLGGARDLGARRERKVGVVGARASGKIGSGGQPLKLASVNGSIKVSSERSKE